MGKRTGRHESGRQTKDRCATKFRVSRHKQCLLGDHLINGILVVCRYGSRSMGPIPANSTLHFDLELVSIS